MRPKNSRKPGFNTIYVIFDVILRSLTIARTMVRNLLSFLWAQIWVIGGRFIVLACIPYLIIPSLPFPMISIQ
jgi:hypothetical protein